MTQSEFSIIDQFFNQRQVERNDVVIGIGDDAAITTVPDGMQLVTTVDTLVDQVHFPAETSAENIGHKSLAVSLSDLAAMGAEPAWATLAITMPEINDTWLREFCDGFFALAQRYNVQLIGGDTTQGPLSVTVQLMGIVPEGKALTRQGTKPGDAIFVSGVIGDAALGLALQQGRVSLPDSTSENVNYFLNKLNKPEPRNSLGQALRGIATAAIDISDGLLADLNHILIASHVGATLNWDQIPLSSKMQIISVTQNIRQFVLRGGDDYEMCFTVPPNNRDNVCALAQQLGIAVSEIGKIEGKDGLRMTDKGATHIIRTDGFEHFQNS